MADSKVPNQSLPGQRMGSSSCIKPLRHVSHFTDASVGSEIEMPHTDPKPKLVFATQTFLPRLADAFTPATPPNLVTSSDTCATVHVERLHTAKNPIESPVRVQLILQNKPWIGSGRAPTRPVFLLCESVTRRARVPPRSGFHCVRLP